MLVLHVVFCGVWDLDLKEDEFKNLTFFREVNNPIDCQDEKDIPGKKAQLKTPKPLPESLRNVERDSVFKILHPYDFH